MSAALHWCTLTTAVSSALKQAFKQFLFLHIVTTRRYFNVEQQLSSALKRTNFQTFCLKAAYFFEHNILTIYKTWLLCQFKKQSSFTNGTVLTLLIQEAEVVSRNSGFFLTNPDFPDQVNRNPDALKLRRSLAIHRYPYCWGTMSPGWNRKYD